MSIWPRWLQGLYINFLGFMAMQVTTIVTSSFTIKGHPNCTPKHAQAVTSSHRICAELRRARAPHRRWHPRPRPQLHRGTWLCTCRVGWPQWAAFIGDLRCQRSLDKMILTNLRCQRSLDKMILTTKYWNYFLIGSRKKNRELAIRIAIQRCKRSEDHTGIRLSRKCRDDS